MKTFGILIALLLVISACETDDQPPPPCTSCPSPGITKYVQLNARLTPRMIQGFGGDVRMEWNGWATSNLLGEVNIYLSHLVQDEAGSGYSAVRDGFLYLWTDDYSSTLSGNYTGQGEEYGQYRNMTGMVEVEYGTGQLAAESGQFSLSITDTQPLNAGEVASDIWINGHISVRRTEETEPEPQP